MSKRNISDVLNETELVEGSPSETQRRFNADSTSKLLPYPNVSNSIPRSIPFQQPTPLTSFSYTPQHVQQFDDSALRYYRSPPPRAQLGYGYERWIRRPEERSRIDSLLRAVDRVTSDGTDKKMELADVGVVAWRGVITRILTAPYEDREGWDMNVMLINGTLYLEEHRSEALITEKNNIKPQHRKMMYYGYAFESYCTTEGPPHIHTTSTSSTRSHPPGWGGDVDTNVQWCSVVRTKLGDSKFIIGGEVDCVQGQYRGTTDTFVELKTSMAIRGPGDGAKFERKLLKFYFQSFLLGVPKIVVGFRTPSGELTTTQEFQTMQIPRMVREKAEAQNAWNPTLCLSWCHNFLTFLKETIRTEDPTEGNAENDSGEEANAEVWRVSFVPRDGVRVRKLESSAVLEVVNGEDRVGFIPRWYWDKVVCNTRAGRSTNIRRTTAVVQPVKSAVEGWQI